MKSARRREHERRAAPEPALCRGRWQGHAVCDGDGSDREMGGSDGTLFPMTRRKLVDKRCRDGDDQ
jgi:hypothetical protein